tara:strand:- start:2172 stop:2366 length:195 start_codon:yes stop_codon:yes gene_type:complete
MRKSKDIYIDNKAGRRSELEKANSKFSKAMNGQMYVDQRFKAPGPMIGFKSLLYTAHLKKKFLK